MPSHRRNHRTTDVTSLVRLEQLRHEVSRSAHMQLTDEEGESTCRSSEMQRFSPMRRLDWQSCLAEVEPATSVLRRILGDKLPTSQPLSYADNRLTCEKVNAQRGKETAKDALKSRRDSLRVTHTKYLLNSSRGEDTPPSNASKASGRSQNRAPSCIPIRRSIRKWMRRS